VVYGLVGLKIHAKAALVVRREGDRIRRYVHLATGNYNTVTAHLYTDLGLFTCDEQIGADVTDLFNYLTGYSAKSDYRKLLVAPINLRKRLRAMIEREIEQARAGRSAHLIFKTNALVDRQIIRLLYSASKAGVQVDLLVRGICCLRPGIPGISDRIRVISIVGRFLEHSRIYYFHNGGEEEVYIGSADLMPRNISRRVEVLTPVQDKRHVRHLRDKVLATYLADVRKARFLTASGSYVRPENYMREGALESQAWFVQRALKKG
jgi:polyphosphate kinase